MDSRDEELQADGHRLNTATENSNTTALQKKPARRVSFAENTLVRIFYPDEGNETHSLKNAKDNANDNIDDEDEGLGGQDDVDVNIDDEDEVMKTRSFLRPICSPSPGGSTFGSASSNDEDNLFGPVSANFIRPGWLSDSAASDDNHDITMDSTAFSMHYHSLSRSDSGADSKTPSAGELFLEERTAFNANQGRSMDYSLDKKAILQSLISTSEVSGSHISSNMSIVVKNPNRYEYEKLSPGLEFIIAENMKTWLPNSAPEDGINSTPNQMKGASGHQETCELGEPSGKTANTLPHHSSNNEPHTPCSTSTSSVLRAATSPSKHLHVMSALLNETGSLLGDKRVECIETSIQKSIKKLELIEKSASLSAFSAKADITCNETGSLLGDERVKSMETSFQKSIKKLELIEKSASLSEFSAKADRSIIKALFNNDTILETLHHISENTVDNSVTEVKIDNSHESKARSGAFSTESTMAKHGTIDTSPLVTSRSENKLIRRFFKTRPSSEDAVMGEIESSAKIASGDMTTEVVSSPYKATERLLLPPTSLQSGQSNDLLPQQSKHDSEFEEGHDLTSWRNLARVDLSSTTNNMDSVFIGSREVLTSPLGGGYRLKGIAEIRTADNGIVDTHDRKELFGISDKTISHYKENKSLVIHPRTMDLCSQISSAVSVVENSMSGTQHITIPHGTISPYGSQIVNWSSLQKNLVEIPRDSLSRNEIDDMHASEKPTSETFQLSGRRDNLSSSNKKLDLAHRVTNRKNEVTVSQRSPKRQKFDECELLCPDEGRLTPSGQSIRFFDVYSKNLDDMKCFLSGSAVRLHSNMIDAMEDILASQQRSKMYELCHRELMSQNGIVPYDGWHGQAADTNSLLHRVVFEKIKLQLKHMKKERLLKRLQLLNHGIQESQVLRANLMSHPFLTSNANPTANAIDYPALSVKLKNGPEVSSEKLTAMRQNMEAIEMEISNLTKSFHKRCKLKGEPSSGGIITAFNEHLIKRASCRLIRSDMQIWAFNSLTSSSCQHNIGLSYLDLVIQRIHIMRGPRLSAKTSFVLDEGKIMKNFPNMDACTAFAFLFRETVHELFDSRTLQWETQVTSSVLGALLDVVNEVQLAQMELPNLTQTRFCSPADQLHLVLCFFNWTNSVRMRKVTLTLDMTCLKRGIYPSEIVPQELKCSSSPSILDELKEEVKTIQTGYMRILRLCRSVSKWLQSSTP